MYQGRFMTVPTITEERIGDYIVHPAAALFPLLEDDDTDFYALKGSIKQHGQLLPILVLGNIYR
jgi:hypothetical protein